MSKQNKWKMNRRDVDITYMGSSGGFNRKKLRYSRSSSECYVSIILQHIPTGISVSGDVIGYYSRAKSIELKKERKKELFLELENRVAKHLKIPGR